MKATDAHLIDLIRNPNQFIIPIFQRNYNWTETHCRQLWSDIVRAGQDHTYSQHFIGSIVYIKKGTSPSTTVPQLLLIDGQQRLTTITLLFHALAEEIKSQNAVIEITAEEIREFFLFNRMKKDILRYKLLLNQSDRETLINLLEGREPPANPSVTILNNHRFFSEMIAKSRVDLETIHRGIAGLKIVDIILEQGKDNPQLIFESLNSTGLDLTQSDLVRNFVLMGLDYPVQKEIYEKCWHPMEVVLANPEKPDAIDRFIRDYLTLKTGQIPNLDQIYREFKNFVHGYDEKLMRDTINDLYTHSKYYARFSLEKEEDRDLLRAFQDINTLRMDVAFPFMLEVFNDYSNKKITKDEFLEILRLLESYVFRRAICGISTSSLNKTFATLSREIEKDCYVESLKAALLLKDAYRRFPDAIEFGGHFMIKDLYNFRNRHYWLEKLENHQHKEPISTAEYTVEHIMPQDENLSAKWMEDLGSQWEDVHKKFLHTAGNLTLTGYNSELSTRTFIEKRDIPGGFRDSHLRLNSDLATLKTWNEREIRNRAQKLSELAEKVWVYPTLPSEILRNYQKIEKKNDGYQYTLEDHKFLTGSIALLFDQLRKRIMSIDPSVKQEIKKLYIAYKTSTNFVDIVAQKSRLRLSINMKFKEIKDPKGMCRDTTNMKRWGNGDVEVDISSPDQIDYVMDLIRQSFEKHR